MPSVFWRCGLGSRKGIRPVKNAITFYQHYQLWPLQFSDTWTCQTYWLSAYYANHTHCIDDVKYSDHTAADMRMSGDGHVYIFLCVSLAKRHQFWWFPHTYSHTKPHLFNSLNSVTRDMLYNQHFAQVSFPSVHCSVPYFAQPNGGD